MGMFLNYQSIADNYIPNNLVKAFPSMININKLAPVSASKPFEEYNAKGELIGYSWRQGETLNLEFVIDGEVTIESTAIVLDTKGQAPSETTTAEIGQRAYNIVDLKSWTCTAFMDNHYVWVQDKSFTYPLNSTRSVYLSAADYLKDKTIDVTLYNFRMEPICTKSYVGSSNITLHIDKQLSSTLAKGVYYCSVVVSNAEVSYTIFDSQDCALLVK